MTPMFYCYAQCTPALWCMWLRRFAREQRPGKWIVTLEDASVATTAKASLLLRHFRCPIEIYTDAETTTFEFLPL